MLISNTVKDKAHADSNRKNSGYYSRKLNSARVWIWLRSQLAHSAALILLNTPSPSKKVLLSPDCQLGTVTALVTSQSEPRDGLECQLACTTNTMGSRLTAKPQR